MSMSSAQPENIMLLLMKKLNDGGDDDVDIRHVIMILTISITPVISISIATTIANTQQPPQSSSASEVEN